MQIELTVPEHDQPFGHGTQAVPVLEKPGRHVKLDVLQVALLAGHVRHTPPTIEL